MLRLFGFKNGGFGSCEGDAPMTDISLCPNHQSADVRSSATLDSTRTSAEVVPGAKLKVGGTTRKKDSEPAAPRRPE